MSWFPTPYPRDRETRIALLNAYEEANPDSPDPFSALDDEFYGVVESENGGFVQAANQFTSKHS